MLLGKKFHRLTMYHVGVRGALSHLTAIGSLTTVNDVAGQEEFLILNASWQELLAAIMANG